MSSLFLYFFLYVVSWGEEERSILQMHIHFESHHVKMKASHKPSLEDCLRLLITTNFCFLLEICKKKSQHLEERYSLVTANISYCPEEEMPKPSRDGQADAATRINDQSKLDQGFSYSLEFCILTRIGIHEHIEILFPFTFDLQTRKMSWITTLLYLLSYVGLSSFEFLWSVIYHYSLYRYWCYHKIKFSFSSANRRWSACGEVAQLHGFETIL